MSHSDKITGDYVLSFKTCLDILLLSLFIAFIYLIILILITRLATRNRLKAIRKGFKNDQKIIAFFHPQW